MGPQDPKGTGAKIPGSPRKNLKRERYITVILDEDDEKGGGQAAGEPCTLDLCDDLVKNGPDQWDMRDALKHGKTSSQDDPSKNKKQYHRDESTKG